MYIIIIADFDMDQSNGALFNDNNSGPLKSNSSRSGNGNVSSFSDLEKYPHSGVCILEANIPQQLSNEAVHHLFNIVPGMETCECNQNTGIGQSFWVWIYLFGSEPHVNGWGS